MTFWDRLDDETKAALDHYSKEVIDRMDRLEYPNDYEEKINKLTFEERLERAKIIEGNFERFQGKLGGCLTNEQLGSWEARTIHKATIILGLLGFRNTSEQLSKIGYRYTQASSDSDVLINTILDGAIKNKYSESASKPRNPYYNEIMEVMTLTWRQNPCGSKKEMIRRILAHYPGKVDESTLKRWIKKTGITPPRPKQYKNFSLVFP